MLTNLTFFFSKFENCDVNLQLLTKHHIEELKRRHSKTNFFFYYILQDNHDKKKSINHFPKTQILFWYHHFSLICWTTLLTNCSCEPYKTYLSIYTFSLKRPTGPIRSSSWDVCLCVCVSPFHVLDFEAHFAPTSRSRMSKSFRDSESLGKSPGKKWSQNWTLFLGGGQKSRCSSSFCFLLILPYYTKKVPENQRGGTIFLILPQISIYRINEKEKFTFTFRNSNYNGTKILVGIFCIL